MQARVLGAAVLMLGGCHPALLSASPEGGSPELVVALELVNRVPPTFRVYCVSIVRMVEGREILTAAPSSFLTSLAEQSGARVRTGAACTDEDASLTMDIQDHEATGTVQVKGGVVCGSLCGWGFTAVVAYQYRQHRWVIVRRGEWWRS